MVGVFIVELSDIFRSQLLGVGCIDDAGPEFDDEVPAGTQELWVSPWAADAVGVAFESAFVVADRVVGIKQRRGNELANVSLDEPVSPSRLQNDMAPLGIPELERIDRNRDVDRVVQIQIHVNGRIDITGSPSDDVGRYRGKLRLWWSPYNKREK